MVGCDGCTDRTAELARAAGGDRVIVHELSPRAGKPAALSKLVPDAKGDIVVLTDANVMLEPGAVRALVRRFRDPAVGAVVGRLRLYNPTRAEFEESLYWKYETALKYYEGKHGAVLGANGGLYAIRRILFSPIRPDTIIDDFVIPVRIAVRGWSVPFEPDAVAHEETTEDDGARVRAARPHRRRRLAGARARPGPARSAHRLRLLLVRLAQAPALDDAVPPRRRARREPAARGAARGLALSRAPPRPAPLLRARARGAARRDGKLRRFASLARYFVAMNAALAVGFWRFVRGTQRATWERTERVAPPPGVRAA